MADVRRFVCIVCPRGCSLEVDVLDGQVQAVRGMACKRGDEYARREVLDPRRSLCSTIRTKGLARRRLPVRTSGPIPLGRLLEAAQALDGFEIAHPVKCGELLATDYLGLGVDLVATDSLGVAGERQ